jgi:hypothetical protein
MTWSDGLATALLSIPIHSFNHLPFQRGTGLDVACGRSSENILIVARVESMRRTYSSDILTSELLPALDVGSDEKRAAERESALFMRSRAELRSA